LPSDYATQRDISEALALPAIGASHLCETRPLLDKRQANIHSAQGHMTHGEHEPNARQHRHVTQGGENTVRISLRAPDKNGAKSPRPSPGKAGYAQGRRQHGQGPTRHAQARDRTETGPTSTACQKRVQSRTMDAPRVRHEDGQGPTSEEKVPSAREHRTAGTGRRASCQVEDSAERDRHADPREHRLSEGTDKSHSSQAKGSGVHGHSDARNKGPRPKATGS